MDAEVRVLSERDANVTLTREPGKWEVRTALLDAYGDEPGTLWVVLVRTEPRSEHHVG